MVSPTTRETFEDLLVWQKAMDLVESIYRECRNGPLANDWGLRDQLQRTAVSIPANIAEGYERGFHKKEYFRFLTIAKGSAGELRCLIQVGQRVQHMDKNKSQELTEQATEISRMLKGLMASLKKGTG
jgi:four helix bundle protein